MLIPSRLFCSLVLYALPYCLKYKRPRRWFDILRVNVTDAVPCLVNQATKCLNRFSKSANINFNTLDVYSALTFSRGHVGDHFAFVVLAGLWALPVALIPSIVSFLFPGQSWGSTLEAVGNETYFKGLLSSYILLRPNRSTCFQWKSRIWLKQKSWKWRLPSASTPVPCSTGKSITKEVTLAENYLDKTRYRAVLPLLYTDFGQVKSRRLLHFTTSCIEPR